MPTLLFPAASTPPIRPLVLLFLLFLCAGCTPAESPQDTLTFLATRGPFTFTVQAEGVLEARTSHVLLTPQIRWQQPEIAYLAPEGGAVRKGDVVVRFDSEKLDKALRTALDALALARANADQKEAELVQHRAELEAQMKNARAAAEIARLQVARLAFVAPRQREIQKLEMERSELQARKVGGQLASLGAIQKEERAGYRLKIQQAETRVKQARAFLARLVLTAPVDGLVVYERNWRTGEKVQEGDVVYPNNPVVRIPDLSVLQVHLQVGEVDARKLKKGQKATVTLSSPGEVHISGKVSSVDRVAKPIRRGSRIKQVGVLVELDSTRADFTPGLSAGVRIVTREVADALAVPQECLFQKDSLTVVYVRTRDGFVPHRATVVQQGADFSVLDCDLKGGERLALQEPPGRLIRPLEPREASEK